jgi:divalent metal cation (Fe/Co/Zn/Cd) transporter
MSGQTVLDLTIDVPHTMLVSSSHAVEHRVRDTIMSARREVREVKIHVHALDGEADLYSGRKEENGVKVIKSDFGQDGC